MFLTLHVYLLVCGQEFVNIRPLVIGGVEVKQGKYPWQATIYLENEQICGGALINRKVVLSGTFFPHQMQ